MILNLVRGAINHALKAKLTRTYGPFLKQSFGRVSLGILTTDFVEPQVLSSNLSNISFRPNRAVTNSNKSFVKHDTHARYFYIDAQGCIAKLEYEWDRRIVRITSTEVPDACGGRGYAKMLAEEALTWIAKNNYRVSIECEFVEDYVKKNPKFQKFVIK